MQLHVPRSRPKLVDSRTGHITIVYATLNVEFITGVVDERTLVSIN